METDVRLSLEAAIVYRVTKVATVSSDTLLGILMSWKQEVFYRNIKNESIPRSTYNLYVWFAMILWK